MSDSSFSPIAIVGMGCMFPKAKNLQEYWDNIREGRSAITDIPSTHWKVADYYDPDPHTPDKVYGKRGGFLETVPFEPIKYGIAPRDLEAIDTSQLLSLVVAEETLKDGGYGAGQKEFDHEKVSVILGVTGTLELVIPLGARLGHPLWRRALKDAGVDDETAQDVVDRIAEGYVSWQENSFPGLLGNVVAGRVANRFDLHGTNCAVDAACASSFAALNLALLELQSGKANMVLAGGVDTFNDVFMYSCFSKTPALSKSGETRPFDHKSDGILLGEGLGMVLLKRLEDAEKDGDRIYAVLKGMGTSSDPKGNAVYAPSSDGQERALRRAYEQSGFAPETIDLVEAHGTGTKAGDNAEIKGLLKVYGDVAAHNCALGTVKSMIGHTKAAAGMASLIKMTKAIHEQVLPPTINIEKPQPILDVADSPFYLNTVKRPWVRSAKHPRRGAVSAFGFGGSNFHLVIEEYTGRQAVANWDGQVQLLPISGTSIADISSKLQSYSTIATMDELRGPAAVARSQFDKTAAKRLVLVITAANIDTIFQKAAENLVKHEADESWSLGGCYFGSGAAGKVAALFPGQGSQYPGMLRDLACQFPQMRDVLDSCEAALPGVGIADYIYPKIAYDPNLADQQKADLTATQVAQPAIGTVALGAYKIFESFGLKPAAAAGHSYGELVALSAAGVISAADLPKISRKRGELMAEGEGDRGGMMAVAMSLPELEQFLATNNIKLTIANRNAPKQNVLSGDKGEIDRAEALLKEQGVSATKLQVAAAFHSPYMAGATKPFGDFLAPLAFGKPSFPVYANVDGQPYSGNVKDAKDRLTRQLTSPVEFVKEINNIYDAGCRIFLEIGASRQLAGLVKRSLTAKDIHIISLDASKGKDNGVVDLANVLAELASLGVDLDLLYWDEGYKSVQNDGKQKKALTIPICGANYRSPYTPRPPRAPKAPEVKVVEKVVEKIKVVEKPVAVEKKTVTEQQQQTVVAPVYQQPINQQYIMAANESLKALLAIQTQTAALHQQFLASQAQTIARYQQLVERQQNLLLGMPMAPVSPVNFALPEMPAPAPLALPVMTAPAAPVAPVVPVQAAPVVQPVPVMPAPVTAPAVQPVAQPVQAAPVAAAPVSTPVVAAPVAVAPVSTPVAVGNSKVKQVVMEVISEKTGYPTNMLDDSMGLDSDLGIDSIKRVEILSALAERLPDSPSLGAEQLNELPTLGDVAAYLAGGNSTAAESSSQVGAPVTSQAAGSDDVLQTVMAVVSEKTGYPTNMLDLSMGLDSDLGIDSIKRVEILSALAERLPNSPELGAEQLNELPTLGDVASYLSGTNIKKKQ